MNKLSKEEHEEIFNIKTEMHPDTCGKCFWHIEKCTLLVDPPYQCIGCYDRETLEEFCRKHKIKLSIEKSENPNCARLIVSGKKKTLTRDVTRSQDKRMHFVDMVLMYIKRHISTI